MIISVVCHRTPFWMKGMIDAFWSNGILVTVTSDPSPVADTLIILWHAGMIIPDLMYTRKVIVFDEFGTLSPDERQEIDDGNSNSLAFAPYIDETVIDGFIHDGRLAPPLWWINEDPALSPFYTKRPGVVTSVESDMPEHKLTQLHLYSSGVIEPPKPNSNLILSEMIEMSRRRTVPLIVRDTFGKAFERYFMTAKLNDMAYLTEVVDNDLSLRNRLLIEHRKLLEKVANPLTWIRLIMEN